jgi:hypothetical protein
MGKMSKTNDKWSEEVGGLHSLLSILKQWDRDDDAR